MQRGFGDLRRGLLYWTEGVCRGEGVGIWCDRNGREWRFEMRMGKRRGGCGGRCMRLEAEGGGRVPMRMTCSIKSVDDIDAEVLVS